MTTPVDLPPLDQILPHRYPFLLVDRIDALEPGQRIIGIKLVAHDEPFLAPGNPPVMPPTMIIESVAQVGAVLVLSMPEHQQKIAVVLGIERVRNRRVVYAGDTMTIEVVMLKLKGTMGRMAGSVRVDGRLMATGVMTFALVPRPAKAESSKPKA